MTVPLSHRESDDAYCGELFRRDGWRVAECRDGIQWLLQRAKGRAGGGAGVRWHSVAFCRTREALARLWHQKAGLPTPELDRLPERINRPGTTAGKEAAP